VRRRAQAGPGEAGCRTRARGGVTGAARKAACADYDREHVVAACAVRVWRNMQQEVEVGGWEEVDGGGRGGRGEEEEEEVVVVVVRRGRLACPPDESWL
jgi:hypothetical protein